MRPDPMPTPATPADLDLIQQTRQGDIDAFGVLVQRYQERVYGVALHMTGNHADADELAQQAFLKAFESLAGFRSDAGFFTWIYRITVNLSIDFLKGRQRFVSVDESDEKEGLQLVAPENLPAAQEQHDERALLWKALNQLSPELRAAAVSVYLHDMTPREAARALGCAEATIHWRMFKARKLLKTLLKDTHER